MALRVRRIGTTTQTDSVARTITVGERCRPPRPRRPRDATATATVIIAPRINLPPQARLADQCGPEGPGQICLGPLVRLGKPKTFDAGGSTDAEGEIVRYEWDVDGNNVYEHDTGANPKLTVTILDDRRANLRVRVTDSDGATDIAAMALTKLEPECQDSVKFERVHVSSPCLRKYEISGGTQYRSKLPVKVNGVTIDPTDTKHVAVNIIGSGLLRRYEVVSGRAVASFPFKDQQLVIQKGALRWTFKDNEIHNAGSLNGRKLGGLEITGAPENIALPSRGIARTKVYLKLPDQFGGPTSEKAIVLTAGSPKPDIAFAAGADDAFEFTVPSASIGPIALSGLKVAYDGEDLWEIAANVTVPVVDATLHAKAGIRDGRFNYAGAEVGFGNPGIGPFGPVFIQRIKFRVEVDPKKSECVPHLGVETETFLGATFTYDYGVPTFALCGEVGLTAGPSVLGAKAISLDAGLGVATYDDRPSVLRAFGNMKVVGIPFADATFEAHTDGFVKVTGRFNYGWDGFASVHGRIALGVMGSKFNAEGGVKACLEFVDFCRGVNALISSKGMAVCMVIDYEIDDWRPGFGYKWGDALPDAYFSGCSLGPYRETIRRTARAASVSEETVTLPANLPGTVIAAKGAGAPPKITLVGPKGERISTPDDLMPVDTRPFFLMKNPQADLTQIAISKPSAGVWRVIVEDGPVTSLKVAHAMTPPRIDVKLGGTKTRRVLGYQVEQRAGQTVSFIERGASTQGEIGAAGAEGRLRWTPAGGAAERREIVAVVEQDGLVAHQLVVARYRAPGPVKPGQVHRLRTQRVKPGLRVTWKPAGARHVVTASFSDGRRIVRNVDGRSLVIRGVARRTRATVAVRAVSASGVLGRQVRIRVR